MNQDTVEAVAVTQADRDAAWPFLRNITSQYGDAFYDKDSVARGWCDDNRYVQAFARHRLSAIPTPPPADHTALIARLRDGAAMSEVLRLNGQLDDAQRMAFGAWAKVGTEAADALQAHASPREVEQIVAWLRKQELPGVGIESVDEHIAAIADDLADAIERGDHRTELD